MTADLLLDRVARLTVARPIAIKQTGVVVESKPDRTTTTTTSRQTLEEVIVENLRMQFRVQKTLGKEPNTAQITVTNLAVETRAKLQSKGSKVILEAGYPPTVAQIFSGDSRLIQHRHEVPDWSTVIECGDGERQYAFARVNESFRSGTPLRAVAQKLAEQLGLDPGNLEEELAASNAQYVSGYVARGPAQLELDRVLSAAGLEWSIQDGRLQVLKKSQALNEVVELSADHGLIGVPEIGSPEKETKKPLVRVQCLLQPRIKPGVRVFLRSSTHTGTLRAKNVTHSGDTSGGEFYTSFEGEPV